MMTRREVLSGTAAASIAAIASARGVAVAADVGCGISNIDGGALAAFNKLNDSFGVFLKFNKLSAEVFYKEDVAGGVQIFFKTFYKGWTPVTNYFLKIRTLEGAVAQFQKIDAEGAQFFIKFENQANVLTTFTQGEGGLQVLVEEEGAPILE